MNEAHLNRVGAQAEQNLLSTPVSQSAPSTENVPGNATAQTEPYPWILSPTIDLLFACGGVFWPIFLFMLFSGAKIDLYGSNVDFTMALIGIMGLQLLGDSHQPATLWRVYFSKTTRDALWKPVTLVALAAAALGCYIVHQPATAGFFVKFIIVASIQHQLAQSYGVALIYCYKRRYFMNKIEKEIMYWMVQSAIAFMIIRLLALKEYGTAKMNGLEIPFVQVLPEWTATLALVVLQVMVLLFAGMVVRKYMKEKRIFPLPAMMGLMTLIIMPFLAGPKFYLLWLWVGSYWFHSCQYLVVTSAFYFKERGLPEGMSTSQIARMLGTKVALRYFASIFFFGFALVYLFPNFLADHGLVAKTTALAAVYVATNMHHFITDSFIWKLKDKGLLKILIA